MKHYYLCISILVCLVASSCDGNFEKIIGTNSIQMKTNIVGVSGEISNTPYVEVSYCKDNGDGTNVIETKWFSPPFTIGDNVVNVLYDSIAVYNGTSESNAKYTQSIRTIHHDYSTDGAEYLKIINHSDKPIEFFIAGTENVVTGTDTPVQNYPVVVTLPNMLYKKAPIYYLLFPEKKYSQTLSDYDNTVYHFDGTNCGDITLTSSWTVDDVMSLYRAEYKHSADTVLTLNTSTASRAWDLLNTYDKGKRIYGVIKPQGQLVANDSTWLINSPMFFVSDF